MSQDISPRSAILRFQCVSVVQVPGKGVRFCARVDKKTVRVAFVFGFSICVERKVRSLPACPCGLSLSYRLQEPILVSFPSSSLGEKSETAMA